GTGTHFAQFKTPREALDAFEQGDVSLQEAAIVEGAHVVAAAFVVPGDYAQGLEPGPAAGPAPDPLDEQQQAIELIPGLFRLGHLHALARRAQHPRVAGPRPDQKFQLLHGGPLRLYVRHVNWGWHRQVDTAPASQVPWFDRLPPGENPCWS